MVPRVKAFDEYLEQIDCDPFFNFDNDSSHVEISSDNTQIPKITARTATLQTIYFFHIYKSVKK